MRELGLYIHIPFCVSKCDYCSFFSVTDYSLQDGYVKALKKELQIRKNECKRPLTSIYIGGGTPTVLTDGAAAEILSFVYKYYPISDHCEITVEANPESLTRQKADEYISCGVNRLSIGLQAAQDELLTAIGRPHRYVDFTRAMDNAVAAGFSNISCDLISALPGQTLKMWEQSLKTAAQSGVKHISCYSLQLEKGTMLYEKAASKLISIPDEDTAADMLELGQQVLEGYGFIRYEISNYAKQGYESRHNINYWRGGEYIAAGAGAHGAVRSRYGITRYQNTKRIGNYISFLNNGRLYQLEKNIAKREEMFETVMLSTRMTAGLDMNAFEIRFGMPLDEAFCDAVKNTIKLGLAEICGGHFRLTERGLEIQNTVLGMFFDEETKGKTRPLYHPHIRALI